MAAEAKRSVWQLIKSFFHMMQAIGRRITQVINLLLVALVYVFAIGPLALFFRFTGRSLLETPQSPDQTTYWLARPALRLELEDFGRQF